MEFSDLGSESQKMIIKQLQLIDLDKISVSAKNLSTLGASLIKILRTANTNQEKASKEEIRDQWIIIRQMIQVVLEDIMERARILTDEGEIPEWERPAIISLLNDISKACQEEEDRTNAGETTPNPLLGAEEEFLDHLLENIPHEQLL